jgi:hypothetical protein
MSGEQGVPAGLPVPKDFTDNPMNKRRVREIKDMLSHYRGYDKYDIRSTLIDVLCDIQILCRIEPDDEGEEMEFDDLCRIAEGHCEATFIVDGFEADTLVLEGYCHYDDDGGIRLNEDAESNT